MSLNYPFNIFIKQNLLKCHKSTKQKQYKNTSQSLISP
jgi:hypothetical protein